MAQPDPVRALVAYLRAQPGIAGLAGSRVFTEELPQTENVRMPQAAVVVSPAGGGLIGNAQLYGDRRVAIVCYGTTTATARTLYNEVRAAMKNLRRELVSDTATTRVLLHWARISAEGSSGRDVATNWPVCTSSWQILAADVPA